MISDVIVAEQQRIDALNLEARKVWHQDVPTAKALAEEAQKLATSGAFEFQTYEKGWMDSLVMLAQTGLKAGLYEEAITQVTRALDFYQQHGFFDVWQLNAAFTMGAANATFGNHTEALKWYQELIKLAEQMQEPAYTALAYRNIGNLYGAQGNFTTAIDFYTQAIPYFEQIDSRSGLASVYGNFCWVYQQSGDFDLALEYAQRTLSIYQEIEHRDGLALTNIHIGNIYLHRGNLDLAAAHLNSAVELARVLGIGSYLADALLNMGRLYARQGNHLLAIDAVKQGLTRAEEIGHKTIQMYCHLALSETYEQSADWQSALQHYRQYSQLKDEIRSEEGRTKLLNLEVMHRTRQAQMEAEVQRQLREEDRRYFDQISQMKDEILSTASHDLKSPLVGIRYTLDSLRRHGRVDDARGQQLMQDIDRTVRQMGELVGSVLDLAKLETGRALQMERHDFTALLNDVLRDLGPAAAQKHIHLYSSLNAETWWLFDRQRLHQVLHNLITNAVKYTDEGGDIAISAQVEDHDLVVAIRDTGVGIPQDALPYVFERFYRVPQERHQAEDGTGLGLAIAKAIVEQHQGKIWVESETGHGSTFMFSLPSP